MNDTRPSGASAWVGAAAVMLGGMAAFASCASTKLGAEDAPAPAQVAPADDTDLSRRSGSKMQPFVLPAADGKQFDVKPHLGKDVVMVSFWATWCSPCKAELESMSAVYERLRDRGFVYIAVSTDNPTDAPKVRPYVAGHGYGFPVLLDTQSTLMQRYNPRGDMPFYVLVNRRGEVVEQHQGFSPGDEVAIEAKILSLLASR